MSRQSEIPQFVLFTADNAVQSYTLDAVNQFLAHRKNPNGCPLKMTYFTSLNYTDWYVAGNEIADHTSVNALCSLSRKSPDFACRTTHVGSPPAAELNGNLIALNALTGIPFDSTKGFRAPFLNYTNETFHLLAAADFIYDSSTTASIPVADQDMDAYWPYTLDHGLANDCLTVDGICRGQPQIPGFWEIPNVRLL